MHHHYTKLPPARQGWQMSGLSNKSKIFGKLGASVCANFRSRPIPASCSLPLSPLFFSPRLSVSPSQAADGLCSAVGQVEVEVDRDALLGEGHRDEDGVKTGRPSSSVLSASLCSFYCIFFPSHTPSSPLSICPLPPSLPSFLPSFLFLGCCCCCCCCCCFSPSFNRRL